MQAEHEVVCKNIDLVTSCRMYILEETEREFLMNEPMDECVISKEVLCPELLLCVHGKQVPCLLDSGAEVSCMSEGFYNELVAGGAKVPCIPVPKLRIIGATSKASPAVSLQAIVNVTGLGSPKLVAMLVIRGLSKPIILGADFLTQNKVKLDFGGWLVSTTDTEDMCTASPECWSLSDNFVSMLRKERCKIIRSLNTDSKPSVTTEIYEAIAKIEALEGSQKVMLHQLLSTHHALFSEKPGRNRFFKADIQVQPDTAFHIKSYPIPTKYIQEAEAYVQMMIEWDIIRHGTSPYANPMVCVRKSDGSLRLCLDARQLNKHTIKARESPRPTEELLRLYSGVKYISSLDLSHSYWQIPLEEDSKKYTGFLFRNQQYVFQVLPFGLCNAVAQFTRCMNLTLGTVCSDFARAYVDDLLITSTSYAEHIEHLHIVMSKLSEAGMTVKLRKSLFCREEVPFLGHIITPHGIRTAPDKLSAIEKFPAPKTPKQLRAFLGIVGFYRNYSDKVARVALPLFELLKKDQLWEWTEARQEAFDAVKALFIREQVIHHPQPGQEFYLYTDASSYALGAKLAQLDDAGVEKTVAMASRTMRKAEKNYSVTEQEMLCIVWVLQKFRHLLLGEKVILFTDHQALTSLKTGRIFSSRLTRWQLLLQEFDIEIRHLKGSQNIVADFLSRVPGEEPGLIDRDKKQRDFFVTATKHEKLLASSWERHFADIVQQQLADPACVKISQKLQEVPAEHPLHGTYCKSTQGVLYQHGVSTADKMEAEWKIIVPATLQLQLIDSAHRDLGHVGIKKTMAALRRQFAFKRMSQQVTRVVRSCDSCQKNKHPQQHLVGVPQAIVPQYPLDLVAVDLFGPLPQSRGKVAYVFVIVDVFTKYTRLFAIVQANAQTVLNKFKVFMAEMYSHGLPVVREGPTREPCHDRHPTEEAPELERQTRNGTSCHQPRRLSDQEPSVFTDGLPVVRGEPGEEPHHDSHVSVDVLGLERQTSNGRSCHQPLRSNEVDEVPCETPHHLQEERRNHPNVTGRKDHEQQQLTPQYHHEQQELTPQRTATAEEGSAGSGSVQQQHRTVVVLSDKGSQFTSKIWQQGIRRLGAIPTTCSVHTPMANPSERVMRSLGNMFRAMCNQNHRAWFSKLQTIEWVLNNTVHASTGYTPLELLSGRRSLVFSQSIYCTPPGLDSSGQPDAGAQQSITRGELIEIARRRLYVAAEARKKRVKPHKVKQFQVGQQVLVKTVWLSRKSDYLFAKFFQLYAGPWVVTKVCRDNCYELSDPRTSETVGRQNVRWLREYIQPCVPAQQGAVTV